MHKIRNFSMIARFNKNSLKGSILAATIMIVFGAVTLPNAKAATSNYALVYDGVNDYCRISHSEALTFHERPFTVELWFYSFGVGAWSDIVLTKGESGDPENSNYSFILQNGGSLEFEWEYNSGTNQEAWIIPWTDNRWHHLAGVFDGNDQLLYLDGELVAHNENVNGPGEGEDRDIYIGVYHPEGPTPFSGYIDEVRIWETARTQEEIQSNMYSALSGTEEGLVGYWDFNEGSGTTAHDKTNNNDCILGGDGLGDDIPLWVASTIPESIDIPISKIKNAIIEKEDIAGKIDAVLDKEWEAYEVLDAMLESGDYGDLKKGDIVKAKQKIHSAMQHGEQSLDALDKSIEKLIDALEALGWEPEPVPEQDQQLYSIGLIEG